MKKVIYLSLVCAVWVCAAETKLETITVDTTVDTKLIKDVNGEDIKSADLGEALFKQSASVSLVRRSGIANDIILRGQKKDNINVTIDGAKVYGACPNRMDPPVSHVLTNNIDYVEINEGPYNVEDFGSLSADVKVHTIEPEEAFHGDVNLGLGSWGYKKAAMSASGAITENVKFLISASTETGGQYEDGDGNDFAGQIDREIAKGAVPPTAQYQPQYRDMDAFEKKTVLAKLFWNITDNQTLKLSYTGNRSDDVLYPSTPMDALADDSDIFDIDYTVKDLSKYSKELSVQLYQSEVYHPMSTKYRVSATVDSNPLTPGVQTAFLTNIITTQTQGIRVKNSFDVENHTITGGLDYSLRNWDGGYYRNNIAFPEQFFHGIWDVDTENRALFIKDKTRQDKWVLDAGLRYDATTITTANSAQQDNDYSTLSGYLFGTYNMDEETQFFIGAGKSTRVPDARELYWVGFPRSRVVNGALVTEARSVGTPNLDETTNYEIDTGIEKKYDNASSKFKLFYSRLDNFIAYNADKMKNNYENVDASIYGFELSGSYIVTSNVYVDYAMAYQRGKKDNPLVGQTGVDLPEIPPFSFNSAVYYDYDETLAFKAEIIAKDKWTYFDAENGEQPLDAYGVINLKATKQWGAFELSVGIDNVFDSTYAVSNTYNDLILLPTLDGNEIMLLNEPGRYLYTNLQYKF